jgi:hypothetical protein
MNCKENPLTPLRFLSFQIAITTLWAFFISLSWMKLPSVRERKKNIQTAPKLRTESMGGGQVQAHC